MIKINSPKPSTASPEKIQPFECILRRRAKKLSSQAWESCIWKSTLRSVAFIQELTPSLCLKAFFFKISPISQRQLYPI